MDYESNSGKVFSMMKGRDRKKITQETKENCEEL